MPSGKAFVNPHARVHLHIGEPVDLSQFEDINAAMAYLQERVAENLQKK
jgi:hypothetical protein